MRKNRHLFAYGLTIDRLIKRYLVTVVIGLEESSGNIGIKKEIYKNVKPYLTNNDCNVKSAAALCVAHLTMKYSQPEFEILDQK